MISLDNFLEILEKNHYKITILVIHLHRLCSERLKFVGIKAVTYFQC